MIKLFKALTLGLALIAASCSQDSDTAKPDQARTTQLRLSMEATFNDDELRNAMKVSISEANNWKLILPTLQEGDVVPLKLAFSNGTDLSHHEVNFTYKNGKLQFAGAINLTNYGDNNNWYVMAFYGGLREGNSYSYAPQVLDLNRLVYPDNANPGDPALPVELGPKRNGGPNSINIPLVSGWTSVTRNSADRGQFSVSLKPLGHFIRVQVENRRDHWLGIYGFEVVSNDYYSSVSFTPDISPNALSSGAFPRVNQRQANQTNYVGGEFLANGHTSPTKSHVYNIWVMPSTKRTTAGEIAINVVHRRSGGEWKFPFKVSIPASTSGLGGNQAFKTLIVKNDHKIYRPLHTIDYVALGNINRQGTELDEGAPEISSNRILYSTYAKKPNVGGAGTRNMSSKDWFDILPRSNAEAPLDYTTNDATGGKVIFRNPFVIYGVNTNNYIFPAGTTPDELKEKTPAGPTRILYAKRRIGTDLQAAYRYTYPQTGVLTVEMVHLSKSIYDGYRGEDAMPSIDDISTEAYWQQAYQFGEVVKRVFPLQGNITNYMGISASGDLEAIQLNYNSGRVGHDIKKDSGNSKLVRLMKDKPLDLRANN